MSETKEVETLNKEAEALFQEKKFEKAINRYEKIVRLSGDHNEIYRSWYQAVDSLKFPADLTLRFLSVLRKRYQTPHGYHLAALANRGIHQYQKANSFFSKATRASPSYESAWYEWSRTLLRQKNYSLAIEKIKKLIEINPDDFDGYALWAKSIVAGSFGEVFKKELIELVSTRVQDAKSYSKFGNILIDFGHYEEAISQYDKVLSLEPKAEYAYLGKGIVYERLHRFELAIEEFVAAINIKSDYVAAYVEWQNCLANLYYPPEMSQIFIDQLTANLDSAEGFDLMGVVLANLQRYEEADIAFSQAVAADESYYLAYYSWGNMLLDKREYQDAYEKFEKATELRKNFTYAHHNIAYILGKLGRYRLCSQKWRENIERYKEQADVARINQDFWSFYYLGSIYHEAFKELDAGEVAYKAALKIYPDSPVILEGLAKLYRERKNAIIQDDDKAIDERSKANNLALSYFRKSRKAYLSVIESLGDRDSPIHSSDLFGLADLCFVFEQYEEAEKYYCRILDNNPNYMRAYQGLGALYVEKKKYRKALELFRKALDIAPVDLDVQCLLASTYLKLNDKVTAESVYQKVHAIAPRNVDALIGLGDVHRAIGEIDIKAGELGEAEDRFSEAVVFMSKALKLTTQRENISRVLNSAEISGLQYSLGYCKVKLIEVQKKPDIDILTEAKEQFSNVEQGTPNYYKAQRARKKIEIRMEEYRKTGTTMEARLVVYCAFFIFVLAQVTFFFGRPKFGYSEYRVEPAQLQQLLGKNQLMEHSQQLNARLLNKSYTNFKSLKIELESIIKDKKFSIREMESLTKGTGEFQVVAIEPINTTSYGLMTFGALIFIIAGISLREMSRLKFGAIELEKASTGAINLSTSLGISK